MADEPLENKTNEKVAGDGENQRGGEEARLAERKPAPRGRVVRGGGRGRGSGQPYRSRPRYHRRRVCAFCVDKTNVIDWKKADNLRRYVADSGSIQPRRKSGLCARHQRRVAVAIKRARHLAIFPYTNEHVRIMSKS